MALGDPAVKGACDCADEAVREAGCQQQPWMCSLVGMVGCAFSLVLSVLGSCWECRQAGLWLGHVPLRPPVGRAKSPSPEEVCATAARAGTGLSSSPWLCPRGFLSPTPCQGVRLKQKE